MIIYLCCSKSNWVKMKKDKQKQVKIARKAIRNDIKLSLISKLKEVTANLGGDAEKLEKEIQKASGKVAKKLSKKLSVNALGRLEAGGDQQSNQTPVKSKNITKQKRGAKSAKTKAVKEEAQLS